MTRVKPKTYQRRGGVIALPREMLTSPQYRALSLAARALVVELQSIWKPGTKAVHLSARRAGELLGVSKDSGARALRELVKAQFLLVAEESDWLNGRAREYRLTWQPPDGLQREPTDEWRHGSALTARPTSHPCDGPTANRRTPETVGIGPTVDRRTRETVATNNQTLSDMP